ncbi:carbohydrate esterase family 12 protein, partial [Piromyces sp. E2]
TIFIAGDSTADGNGANNGKTAGWGKYLGDYFSVKVNNQAKSGQSARTFWRDGRWNALIKDVKKGDYVLIEFGHNDAGGPNTAAAKGSVVGTGNETVTVKVNGKNEVVHTFSWYIRQMVNQVKAKGATPVLLSNTPNFNFNKGKLPAAGRFQGYMKLVATEAKIPFIDHYNYIARQWEKLGENYI